VNNTKVLFPEAYMWRVFKTFRFLAPKTIILLGFPIFLPWVYLVKLIPETLHAHLIWYISIAYVVFWYRTLYQVEPVVWSSIITSRDSLQQIGGFSSETPVSSTNKTDHHDITEILLKVALNTINLILIS